MSQQPEYLEQGGGGPLPPTSGGRRKPLLLAGAGVAALAVAGGAAAAAVWYFADGAQSAEAFPADSIGYVGVTLDPSGQQKLEALETLQKFPALSDELGLDGDLRDIDVKERLAELVLEDAPCEGLTYADDLEPWLGDRVGVALVMVDGAPQPVGALEVTDADAAESGVETLLACGADSSSETEDGAFQVDGGWLMLADSQEVLDEVADRKADGTLDGDDDFQDWTGRAGGEGVVTMYAAPEAGQVLLDQVAAEVAGELSGELGSELGGGSLYGSEEELDQLDEIFADFEGAAMTLRFVDGALEVQGGAGLDYDLGAAFGGQVGEAVSALPAGTALAYGAGLGEGWFDALVDYAADAEGLDPDDLTDELELTTGLTGEDLEAAAGDHLVLAVGGDIDLDDLASADLGGVPLALLLGGGEDDVQLLVDALAPVLGPFTSLVGTSDGDNGTAVGPDGSFRDGVAGEEGETLGDSERFGAVVPDADDASVVVYLDLDALDEVVEEFLTAVARPDEAATVLENLAPLSAFGGTSSYDDGTFTMRYRLATD